MSIQLSACRRNQFWAMRELPPHGRAVTQSPGKLKAHRECYRHWLTPLRLIALLGCVMSIARAQQTKIEILVLPGSTGHVVVEGNGQPAVDWSFRDSYAGVLDLGSRIDGLRL